MRSCTRRTFVSTGSTGLAEREVPDRGGGVRADAGQLGQVVRPAALGDHARGAVQGERAPVVAEPLPLADHVAGDAAASAVGVGQRSSQASQRGMTRSTCVCCSITSETRIAYGSLRLPPGQIAPVFGCTKPEAARPPAEA